MSEKLDSTEYGAGPKENRSCTDILCLILFVAFGVACGIIGVYAFENGNPSLLAQPYDPDHKPCGVGELADYPFIYFAAPGPETLYRTVCVKQCPGENDKTLACSVNSVVTSCNESLSPTDSSSRVIVYETTTYGGIICLPKVQQYMDKISEALNVSEVDNAMKDLRNTWMIITASGFLAILIGFIFLKLLRYSAGCVVWSSILLFILGLVGAGFYFFHKFQVYQNTHKNNEAKVLSSQEAIDKQDAKYIKPEDYEYVAYFFWGLAGLFTVIICCLSSRIRLSIAVIKCSARFVEDTKSILLVPVVFFILTFVYIVYWIVAASNLYSCGTISDKPHSLPFGQFEFDKRLEVYGYTHLFSLFWSTCFLIASCQFIIIGACAYWYYQRGGPSTSKAISLFLSYHIGTVAFGSLILAIVQVIRVIFEYMANQAKQSGAENNQAVQCAIRCMECFLACFERFISFLNKNAYINTVMTGNSFCPAAKDAFGLLLRNPARVSLVSGFGEFFEFLGNFAIMVATTGLCYLVITNTEYYTSRLSSPVVPTICFAIISYTVGNFFMSLVGTAADCIIILFCMDEEMHSNPKYEPPELRDFRDEHESASN